MARLLVLSMLLAPVVHPSSCGYLVAILYDEKILQDFRAGQAQGVRGLLIRWDIQEAPMGRSILMYRVCTSMAGACPRCLYCHRCNSSLSGTYFSGRW